MHTYIASPWVSNHSGEAAFQTVVRRFHFCCPKLAFLNNRAYCVRIPTSDSARSSTRGWKLTLLLLCLIRKRVTLALNPFQRDRNVTICLTWISKAHGRHMPNPYVIFSKFYITQSACKTRLTRFHGTRSNHIMPHGFACGKPIGHRGDDGCFGKCP
jgi:hypothetical protein